MSVSSFGRSVMKVGHIISQLADGKDINEISVDPDISTKGKITKLLSNFVITPNVFIDENLKYMDKKHLKNLVKTELTVFTAFLINAYKALTEIYNVHIAVVISSMRKPPNILSYETVESVYELANEDFLGEAYFGKGLLNLDTTIGIENRRLKNRFRDNDQRRYPREYRIDNEKDTIKAETFINSFNIQLAIRTQQGRYTISLPLIVAPRIRYINAENFINSMIHGDKGKTFLERWWDYRAGAISLMDFILASDLIRKYKARKLSSESDLAIELNKIDKSYVIKDLIHDTAHYHKNFNIYNFDISAQTLIESNFRGSVLKDKYKQKMMDEIFGFLAAFVDNEKEEVVMLLDEIPGFSVLSFDMLAKDKKSDVAELAEIFLKNQQPF